MIKRTWSEQKVLKKLDIPDFRHMSKDKIVAFASMVHKMDPDVAKAALAQFPDFAGSSVNVMQEYRQVIETVISSNEKELESTRNIYYRVMDALERIQDHNDLTFDQEMEILREMELIADKVAELNKGHQELIVNIIKTTGAVAATVVIAMASQLGSSLFIGKDD